MRYVSARYMKEVREEVYRIYISDIFQSIITSLFEGDLPRYYDLFHAFGKKPENEANLNPEAIINRIRNKIQQ